MEKRWMWCLFVLLVSAAGRRNFCIGTDVTYDGRSLIIDGERKILFSGSIHYPRSTPDMWPSLISNAKNGGLDVIQTYAFWNLHEPQPGQYDFTGRRDIVTFMKQIQAQGLFVSLRIGPFIESEWTYGGLPIWLRDVPGIVFRSNNDPFKFYMQNFTTKIVNMMKSEGLFASQGGPIILSQIENEYQNVEKAYHEDGPPYVRWAAQMAVGLQTGVPWMMCKQDDAPDPVINTCNGMKCGETFTGPNSPSKPSMWTENWTTYFQVFGGDTRVRSVEDLAYHVALFIAKKNGSFINYYMYHGGTNFGRTGSAFTPPSYYDLAPLDEYGHINQPKWGHLKELHAAVKLGSQPLLSGLPSSSSLGPEQEAYAFGGDNDQCIAFLVNSNVRSAAVKFNNLSFDLPPVSISILPDCKTVAFNTAKVSTQHSTRSFLPSIKLDSAERWEQFIETIPKFDETSLRSNQLLEQMSTTKDVSDYLWYTFSFQQHSSDSRANLSVKSLGHVVHAYVNGLLVGSAHGSRDTSATLETSISLNGGLNNISILSVLVGLPDSGAYLERRTTGLRSVRLIEEANVQDFTNYSWGYQVGLVGEKLQVYTDERSQIVPWNAFNSPQPLSWYKTKFDAPEGSEPVVLNLGSMGKGEAWVNGQSIGRYWISFFSPSGNSTQTWYNVPRSFLQSKDNVLVLVDEESGNPLGISIDTVSITRVCGHVSETHPPPVVSWRGQQNKTIWGDGKHHGRRPKFQLACPGNKRISEILFASYGTPLGNCNNYAIGRCHLPSSKATVEKACLDKGRCTVVQSIRLFGGDPCPGVSKSLKGVELKDLIFMTVTGAAEMTGYVSNDDNGNEQEWEITLPRDSALLDEDGCSKRTGNLWTASAHIITAVIGAGVLALAWAVAQLGWIAGPIIMLLFSLATYYTSTLLAASYRNGDPLTGTRNCTYIAAVRANLGGFNVKLCGIFQYINLYGLSVGYTIAGVSSLMAIHKGICLQTRNGDDPCNVSNTPYMIGFGAVQILLSQIPALDQIWWLSILASIMSFTYSSIGLVLGITKVAATGIIKGSLTGVSVGVDLKMIDKIWRCCQAIGNIAFAYTFSNILVEIQNTVRSPPSEIQTMKKASLIGVSITSFFYLLVGCFGYAAFGDNAPENLIGDGFLKPYWVIHVANFAVLFHMLGAYQVYCQPMFNLCETTMARLFPKNVFINYQIEITVPFQRNVYKLNFFKLVFRILYVISTTFIAKLVPFFSSILGLLGAFAYWPLTIYFPIEMHIRHARIPKWTAKWVCLKILSTVFLLIAGAAAAGSLVSLLANIKRA